MRLDDVYTPTVPNKSDPNTITKSLEPLAKEVISKKPR